MLPIEFREREKTNIYNTSGTFINLLEKSKTNGPINISRLNFVNELRSLKKGINLINILR